MVGKKEWYTNLSNAFAKYGKTWLQQTHKLNDTQLEKLNSLISRNGSFYVYGYTTKPVQKIEHIFKITKIVQDASKKIVPPDNTAPIFSSNYDIKQGHCENNTLEYHLYLRVSNIEKINSLHPSSFVAITSGKPLDPYRMITRNGRFYVKIDPVTDENFYFNDDAELFIDTEGRELLKKHLRKERSSIVVKKFKETLTNFSCACCDFNFQKTYGSIGENFIEAHHIKPLAELEGEVTVTIDDLAPLCSNCHRMIHRSSPHISIMELSERIKKTIRKTTIS